MKRKVIIDTDPGHDDVLAIMLMVKSRLFNIQAITTVAGNSTIENVTKNAVYVLDLLHARSIPIYNGEKEPISRALIQAVVHGTSGLAGADASKILISLSNNAVEKIIEIVRSNPKKITLLTLGPLSNIARAFIKAPELTSLIKEVVIMGGAIDVPGNKNRVAEFNFFVDPEAADMVFRSKVKKTLIPIDACNDAALFLSDFKKLKGNILYEPVMSMMKSFIRSISKYEGAKGALVYDAIAAYYLVNPDAFIFEPMDVVIETKGEYTFGMSVAEKRIREKKRYNVKVARKLNKNKFRNEFINILNS